MLTNAILKRHADFWEYLSTTAERKTNLDKSVIQLEPVTLIYFKRIRGFFLSLGWGEMITPALFQLHLKNVSEFYKDEKLPLHQPSIYCFLGCGLPKAAAKAQHGYCTEKCSSVCTKAQLVSAVLHCKDPQQRKAKIKGRLPRCLGFYLFWHSSSILIYKKSMDSFKVTLFV